jgi:hypothetical protein
MAGHDIDYIAIGGALWPMGRADSPPVPPLNLVGDFGGGGMLLAFGMVSALLEAARSGQGQVVDAAMVDGAATLMTMIHAFHASGMWNDERGANMLDTGAPFYEVYETADGKYFAVGGIEPQFYAELLEGMGLAGDPLFAKQNDKANWPAMKERFAAVFATKTRDEWDRHLRRDRRLRRAGPLALGGASPSAQPGPVDLRRGRRRRAAGAGATVQPHALVHQPPALAAGRDTVSGCSSGVLRRGPWPSCGRRAR